MKKLGLVAIIALTFALVVSPLGDPPVGKMAGDPPVGKPTPSIKLAGDPPVGLRSTGDFA